MPSGPGSCRKPTPETLTLVNVDVQSTPSLWEVNARPTMTLLLIAMVSEPTVVHDAPSVETDPVSVDPVRTIRTQYGATTRGPAVQVLAPPTAVRRWKAAPFPGVITIIAWRAASERPSRIMTPAFAQGSVFWTLATRATIVPSPVI